MMRLYTVLLVFLFAGYLAAEGVATPYGTAVQATTAEARAALTEVQNANGLPAGSIGAVHNRRPWPVGFPA